MIHPIDLPGYCMNLVSEVIEKSGRPFLVSRVESGEFDSELQLAHPGRNCHTLEYLRAYQEHRTHFVMSAAKKILRVYEAPAEERFVPASSIRERLAPEDERVLSSFVPGAHLRDFSCFIRSALVRQLTSFPTDLRVERELFDEYSEHRPQQASYLRRQVVDFLPTLDEEMAPVFPERVYRASTAMNIAFAEEAARISETESPRLVRRHSKRELGEQLLHELEEIREPRLAGDLKLTDRWAEVLGLEEWYSWVRYEV